MKKYKVYLDYQYQNKYIGIKEEENKVNKYQVIKNGWINPTPVFSTNSYKSALIIIANAKKYGENLRIDKWCLIK